MNKLLIKIIFLTIIGTIAFIGCASESSDDTSMVSYAIDPESSNDIYCLACHGGSYAEHARITEEKLSLGEWNPHNSAHAAYFHCSNCHDKDKELSNNQCANCHAYKPDPTKFGVNK